MLYLHALHVRLMAVIVYLYYARSPVFAKMGFSEPQFGNDQRRLELLGVWFRELRLQAVS
jgi:hypothetical protein